MDTASSIHKTDILDHERYFLVNLIYGYGPLYFQEQAD